jgi:hypothetical protein
MRNTFLLMAIFGCAPEAPSDGQGRPFDVLQQRVRFAGGDRFDRHMDGRFGLPHRPPPAPANKDWNYNLGSAVTSAVAIYNSAYGGGTLSSTCSDRMFVATTANGNNLWGFDRLYAANPACTNAGSDGGRCTSSYCPHRMWNTSLSGKIDRSAVTLSLDGTVVYAATSAGLLYAVDAGAGTITWTFDAGADIGSAASFLGAAPWITYGDGSMYIGASYGSGSSAQVRLYRISAAGTKLYSIDFGTSAQPESIESTVLATDAIYFGTTGGRVYKVFDSGSAFSPAGSPWPVQLSGETRTNGRFAADTTAPIAATPTLDTVAGALFVPVNNVMWSVNTSTGAKSSQGFGWNTSAQAQTTDVPCFSSPWADLDNHVLFVGHGRFSNAGSQNRIFAIGYNADGTLVSVADSTNTRGTAATVSLQDPKSSPIFISTNGATGNVFMGDAGGFLDKWSWNGTSLGGRTTFGTNPSSGIGGPVMIDFISGFLYFGTDNGHVYQITQSNLN